MDGSTPRVDDEDASAPLKEGGLEGAAAGPAWIGGLVAGMVIGSCCCVALVFWLTVWRRRSQKVRKGAPAELEGVDTLAMKLPPPLAPPVPVRRGSGGVVDSVVRRISGDFDRRLSDEIHVNEAVRRMSEDGLGHHCLLTEPLAEVSRDVRDTHAARIGMQGARSHLAATTYAKGGRATSTCRAAPVLPTVARLSALPPTRLEAHATPEGSWESTGSSKQLVSTKL